MSAHDEVLVSLLAETVRIRKTLLVIGWIAAFSFGVLLARMFGP